MNNKRTKFIVFLFLFTLIVTAISPLKTASAAENSIDVNASSAIIIEESTGTILYGKNIDEKLPVASMAKVMTEYLVLEAVKEGRIKWEQTYTPSEYVYKISQNKEYSNVPLRQDGSYTVKELYEAMAIYSANGAAIGLAEIISGTETNFIKLMNEKAKELGLTNYEFVNATGLENGDLMGMHPEGTSPDAENKLSARDMALLSQKLIQDFPEVIETASIAKKTFKEGTEMLNWNWMLPDSTIKGYEYEGVDGLKTGSTNKAGSCFTATATKNGMRVVAVVMNAKGENLHSARFLEMEKMLNYGFNNFAVKEIFPAKYQVEKQSSLPVVKGKEKSVSIQTKDPLTLVIRNGDEKAYKAKFNINKDKLTKNGELTAPLKKGEKVGTMTVSYTGNGEALSFIQEGKQPQVDVVTEVAVEKANWFVLSMRAIGSFFSGLWGTITDTVKGWF
ncbi:D-alanyl-D-alanine carboxypeptidase [Bacillus sp. 7586-K]|nr:D-alanyl-D-alanine carboxypeptidase [Bacillus sp. 7586-K]